MAEPSKPSPSEKAPSSSAGAMATDFKNPRTSVNHIRTNRTSRSSMARNTNSVCLSTAPVCRLPVAAAYEGASCLALVTQDTGPAGSRIG